MSMYTKREVTRSDMYRLDELLHQIEPFQQYVSTTQRIYQFLLEEPEKRKRERKDAFRKGILEIVLGIVLYMVFFSIDLAFFGDLALIILSFFMGGATILAGIFAGGVGDRKKLHPNEFKSAQELMRGNVDAKLQYARNQVELIGKELNPIIDALPYYIRDDVVKHKVISAKSIANMMDCYDLEKAYEFCLDRLYERNVREEEEKQRERARRERREQQETLEGIRDSINQSNRDAQRRFEYEQWRAVKRDINDDCNRR